MASERRQMPFTKAVQVNPRVSLKRGELSPFVDMKAINASWRGAEESEYREFKSGGAKFMPLDTLMARITPCLENGKIARYMPKNTTGNPAFGSTEFIVIRGRDDVTDNDFAYYLTKWESFRRFAISQMTGSSGRQRVPTESLAGFHVPVPTLLEQKAIAHILGTLDDKIELNRKMNETLEGMAQALFKSWFVDFDPVIDNVLRKNAAKRPSPSLSQGERRCRDEDAIFDGIPDELIDKTRKRPLFQTLISDEDGGKSPRPVGEDLGEGLPDEIRQLFPDSFEESELGWIPRGWEVCTIKSVSEKISKGTTPRKKDISDAEDNPTVPFLKVKDIDDNGRINLSGMTKIPRSIHEGVLKRSMLCSGDVLLSIAGTIGRVSIVTKELDGSNANQAVAFVRLNSEELSPHFMRLLLKSERIQGEIHASVVHAVQANFSLGLLGALCLVKPSDDVLKCWIKYCDGMFGKDVNCSLQIQALETLRDTLLPKLLSGELRIEDAEKFIGGAV